MLPVEAMSMLGSLAGIGEIAKATFGESAASGRGRRRGGSVPSTGGTPPAVPPRRGRQGGGAREGGAPCGGIEGRVMTDMFVSLGNWNWLIFGFILMALEVLAPGIFLFWLGLAALLVGLISFTVAVSWQIQLVMFAVFAAAAVPVWRRLARPKPEANASPFLNKRTEALLGREFTLEKPIIDGSGTVRIGDTVWRVAGPIRRRARR